MSIKVTDNRRFAQQSFASVGAGVYFTIPNVSSVSMKLNNGTAIYVSGRLAGHFVNISSYDKVAIVEDVEIILK